MNKTVMTKEEVINSLLEQAQDKDNLAIGDPFGPDDPENIFAQDAKALREAARLLGEMKLPNDSLPLEELREMDSEDGTPVYTTRNGWLICYGLVSKGDEIYMDVGMGCLVPMTDYGKTWLAYRNKPEEGTTA